MKKMKKLLSVLLTMIMVFAMSAPAFAEAGSITVTNPLKGEYKLYKIFDVIYAGDKTPDSGYAYSTSNTDEAWIAFLRKQGFELTEVKNEAGEITRYNVTNASNVNAGEFAAALSERNLGGPVQTKTVEESGVGTPITFNVTELGYYFVDTTTGSLCNLTTTEPNATIKDKNDVIFEKEANDITVEGVQIGEEVPYTLSGKVADVTGFSSYNYVVEDTMGTGLTFKKDSLKVTIGGVEEKFSNETPDANGFKITIPFVNENGEKIYNADADIEITYTATVNESAKAIILNNKATLTYGPNDNTQTIEREVNLYSSKIVIDKFEEGTGTGDNNPKKSLSGATFYLYKEVASETEGGASTIEYYQWDETSKRVNWVTDRDKATPKTTGTDGAAEFEGLKDGEYKLIETAAPAGYNLLKDPVDVSVKANKDADGNVVVASLTVTKPIGNNTGALLPSTGGIGTTIFYAAGIVLMAGAVFFVVRRKRA